ncbi:MAG: hypothetical protein PWQ37_1874 [Candidatus Petromonas sp.]|jgi:hypothetical protein|nr:hypothetical protein [Candidatus Petromonas sp.]
MRRKGEPYNRRRYLVDTNPLSKVIHDLESEKKSCNIHKIIKSYVIMLDTKSQVNRFLLLNNDYNICKCCMTEKHKNSNKI